jgi:hypothetical protein
MLILLSILIVGLPWILSCQCTSIRVLMQRPTIGHFQQSHTSHLRLYSLGYICLPPWHIPISTSPQQPRPSYSHPTQSSIGPIKQAVSLMENGHKTLLEYILQQTMDCPACNAILDLSKSIKIRSNKHQAITMGPSLRGAPQSILGPSLQRPLLPKHKH